MSFDYVAVPPEGRDDVGKLASKPPGVYGWKMCFSHQTFMFLRLFIKLEWKNTTKVFLKAHQVKVFNNYK